ncbi:hypothetical protein KA005_25300, partial [bacterium]|nr:hypothetical protein [bacterium]
MTENKSFWTTLPGILTGVAGVISAIGGLLLVLHSIGAIDLKKEEKKPVAIEKKLLSSPIQPTTPATGPATIISRPALSTVEKNDILFELQECKISGRNIICDLLITSKTDIAPEEFMIHIKGYCASKIVDYEGKEYFASLVKLGTKSHNRSVEDGLYANIPKNASLHFDDIAEQVQKITRLELECFLLPGDRITV